MKFALELGKTLDLKEKLPKWEQRLQKAKEMQCKAEATSKQNNSQQPIFHGCHPEVPNLSAATQVIIDPAKG